MDNNNLEKAMAERFIQTSYEYAENVGRAKERINEILSAGIFKDLSKHNPYWDSENDVTADKLNSIRQQLGWFHDQLSSVFDLVEED